MADRGQTGRCLCGAVHYTLKAPAKWTALCHCDSCRRAASAPVVAWMGYAVGDVVWDGDRQHYASSPWARRSFCGTCGAQLSFESDRWPGEIHLYAVTLDAPETYVPQLHCHHGEHLSWLRIDDDLPVFDGQADPVAEGAS